MITVHQLVNLSFITLLAVIGAVHFLRTSYADKIRTRMIYESFIMLDIVSFLFLVLQPQHEYELEGIMIVVRHPSSPISLPSPRVSCATSPSSPSL